MKDILDILATENGVDGSDKDAEHEAGDAPGKGVPPGAMPAWRRIEALREKLALERQLKDCFDDL